MLLVLKIFWFYWQKKITGIGSAEHCKKALKKIFLGFLMSTNSMEMQIWHTHLQVTLLLISGFDSRNHAIDFLDG